MPNPLEDVARGLRVIGDQIKRTVGNDPAGEWIAERIDALRPSEPPPARSLAELQEELDSLVGLETVKEQVRALVAFLQVQARRMTRFLDSNPGLRSRFAREIVFPDYRTAELLAITGRFARENEYKLAPGAEDALRGIFEAAERTEGFGNARFARTIFEQALNTQALRLAGVSGAELGDLAPEELMTLTPDDLLAAARALGETGAAAGPRNPFRRRRRAS